MSQQTEIPIKKRMAPTAVVVAIWIIAVVLAIVLDSSAERLVLHFGIFNKDSNAARIIRAPGQFGFTIAIATLLTIFHSWKWRAGGLLCLTGIPVGLFYVIIKWIAGRYRPPMPGDVTIPAHTPFDFQLFRGGIPALWKAQAMGFPSGHTMLAFATASVLALCLPKFRWIFYILAAIVGIERIWEYTHYFSDVVAGAGLGILACHLTLAIVRLMMPASNAQKES